MEDVNQSLKIQLLARKIANEAPCYHFYTYYISTDIASTVRL